MTSRRSFFSDFLANANIIRKEFMGIQHFALADLWNLSDSEFSELAFMLREGTEIQYNETDIQWIKNDRECIFLCQKHSLEERVFMMMQQRLKVEEISNRIKKVQNYPEEKVFFLVRGYILHLVKQGICVPAIYEKI